MLTWLPSLGMTQVCYKYAMIFLFGFSVGKKQQNWKLKFRGGSFA